MLSSKSKQGINTWDILQVTHEGATTIKIAKFQRLTTAFEVLRMEDMKYLINFILNLMTPSTRVLALVNKYPLQKLFEKS